MYVYNGLTVILNVIFNCCQQHKLNSIYLYGIGVQDKITEISKSQISKPVSMQDTSRRKSGNMCFCNLSELTRNVKRVDVGPNEYLQISTICYLVVVFLDPRKFIT